jgi:ribonuclease I
MKNNYPGLLGRTTNLSLRKQATEWIARVAFCLVAGLASFYLIATTPAAFAKELNPEPKQAIVLEGIKPDPQMAFGHYTFATMWFPGVCQAWRDVGAVCAKELHNPTVNQRLTLHGLWPSRPKLLIDADIKAPTWWHYGCYWFDAEQKIPESATLPPLDLPKALQTELDRVMPLTQTHLDRHEYTKHIACFGPTPAQYFSTATALLAAVNASSFGEWLGAHQGQTVSRAAIQTAFKQSFKQADARAMQLRCAAKPGSRTNNILTEIWFTIPTDQLERFPAPQSLGAGLRGNCAARILIAKPPINPQ